MVSDSIMCLCLCCGRMYFKQIVLIERGLKSFTTKHNTATPFLFYVDNAARLTRQILQPDLYGTACKGHAVQNSSKEVAFNKPWE